MKDITIEIVGPQEYDIALAMQLNEKKSILEGKSGGKIFILTHDPPVVTMGRKGNTANLKVTQEVLSTKGYHLRSSSRGGDITVHEPGQAVVYFILPLPSKMAGIFIESIVSLIIDFLLKYSLQSYYDNQNPGIWINKRKICSIGFDLTGGVSMHGIALNVSNSLDGFDLINPCGMDGNNITSLANELAQCVDFQDLLCNLQNHLLENKDRIKILG